MTTLQELISLLYPEFLVLLALIFTILLGTTRFKNIIWILSITLLTLGVVHLTKNQLFLANEIQILNGMYVIDNLSTLFRLLTLLVSILIILGSVKYANAFVHKSEYLILLLSSILGIMFLVGANDLITIFIAFETLGLTSIMLSGYSKYDTRSNEASLKYLLSSASASSIFLFGMSIIYGITSSTKLDEIKHRLLDLYNSGNLNNLLVAIVLILIISGIAFKLSSVPLHMWSPDVYEGSPTPVTAFLSVASKAAALAIGLRLIITLFDYASNIWQPIILILCLLSMILGNMVALGEVINKASIKRLMAYSSIAQIGYILIGLSLFTDEALSSSIFYLIIYSFMNIGAFLCIIAFGNEANSDAISDYSGLIHKKPLLTLALSICLFNLAGLPVPPSGFIAKFMLIKASFESGLLGIFVGFIALLTTIISIYYYSYIAKIMIVDKPSKAVLAIDSNSESLGKSYSLNTAILIAVIVIFITSIFSPPLIKLSNKTITSFSTSQQLISMK